MLIRTWLREQLSLLPGRVHIEHTRSGAVAIDFCRKNPPDLVITEISLPDIDGFVVADQISSLEGTPKVLAFTSVAGDWVLYQLRRTSIHGVVWKTADASSELNSAIREIRAGRSYFPPDTRDAITRLRCKPDAFFKILSERELALLPLLGRGLSDIEVGRSTALAPPTVRCHRQNIMRKVGVHRRQELIEWCIAKGIVHFLRSAPPCEIIY
jgi:DNA-binding NarL/FixJ family response regulator